MGNRFVFRRNLEAWCLARKVQTWATLLSIAALGEVAVLPLIAAATEGRNSAIAISRHEAGEKLARQVCGSCHLFPEPQVLDKRTWREQVLARMEAMLGVSPPDYSSSPEGELLRQLRYLLDCIFQLIVAQPRPASDPERPLVYDVAVGQVANHPMRYALVCRLPQQVAAEHGAVANALRIQPAAEVVAVDVFATDEGEAEWRWVGFLFPNWQ